MDLPTPNSPSWVPAVGVGVETKKQRCQVIVIAHYFPFVLFIILFIVGCANLSILAIIC